MAVTERVAGREHFPNYPKGFVVLRILQLIFAVILLGLCGYIVSIIIYVGAALMIFTSLVTLIVTIWLVSAHTCAPRAYNYWAVLVFDVFLTFFWLVSFGIQAANSAVGYVVLDGYDLDSFTTTYTAIITASAALGCIQFIMFLVGLIIHSVVIHRHRRAGGHSKPGRAMPTQSNVTHVPMIPQTKTDYAAVPQHGFPYGGAEAAYNPNQMYNPPAQPQGGMPIAYSGYYQQQVPQDYSQNYSQQPAYPQQHSVTPNPGAGPYQTPAPAYPGAQQ